ncbi:MAG TPA: capsule assembly Wzi family protein, partial [Terriglobales bacterium]|nr:capsule assembly Wzi family protein [Terriglobales bacterium]
LPASMYLWGGWQGTNHQRETGLLTGEALADGLIVNEGLKFAFNRERPAASGGNGQFFSKFGDSSFPSTHSMLSWTAASVLAHEYPGPLVQALAYGTAATVSIARVTGRDHFPSDVVVGGALGWLIGRQVYRAHHNSDLDIAEYGSFTRQPGELGDINLGSPYVPLDSWVYPALKRLASLGYIRSQFTGLEPWTRRECMRQIEEAEYYAQDLPKDSEVAQTITRLKQQFSNDGQHYYSAQIDSVYTRYMQISGPPLRDSYHFGQSIWNDFGRPYDQGTNVATGAEASAVAGPAFFYVRGEYEHAPGRGPLGDAQRNLIASLDVNPVQPANPITTINRFYPLDMYAGLQMGQYALTLGKQSLWLSPDESAPLMLSDNADPMYMLRLTRTSPLELGGIFHFLGSANGEFLFAKLSGHQFPERPFFNLQKISFHPTENLEVGFTRASIWAGVGHPFTFHNLLRNFGSLSDSSPTPDNRNDPGDRKSGLDFSYKVPYLRNWLTLYSDAYSDDDPSPLANPRRAAINPGIYLCHFPLVSRLDFRAETTSTQSLTATDRGGTFIYINNQYHDANTNKGFLFGSPTGRDARSYQGWSTYHFSGANSLQVSYRQTKIGNGFLPGGGTQSDAIARWQWQARPDVVVESTMQYERWLIPSLQAGAEHNVTGSIELRYVPHLAIHAD